MSLPTRSIGPFSLGFSLPLTVLVGTLNEWRKKGLRSTL